MKVKCPACSKVLNVPDTAAGKVIKCPCGKQLRAPGGSTAGQASTAAAAPASTAKPTQPSTPAASPLLGGFDPEMLDELTDRDLQPVKSVGRPGVPVVAANPKKGEAALQRHVADADRRAEALISTGFAPMPPFLVAVAILNALGSLFPLGMAVLILGVMSTVPMAEEDFEAGEGLIFGLITAGFLITGLLYLFSSVGCFVRGKVTWYMVVASYCFGIIVALDDILIEVMDGGIGFFVVRRLGRLVICGGIWAWLHGEDVRAFFGTDLEPIGRVALMNTIFFGVASGLWLLPTFMDQ